jgi:hypothetical protein
MVIYDDFQKKLLLFAWHYPETNSAVITILKQRSFAENFTCVDNNILTLKTLLLLCEKEKMHEKKHE